MLCYFKTIPTEEETMLVLNHKADKPISAEFFMFLSSEHEIHGVS